MTDDKPTPQAGMRAADVIDPTLPGSPEISASRPDSTMVILEAIGALKRDVDDQIGSLRRELRDTDKRLTSQIGEQASALTQVAKAAATAANMALESKQQSGRAEINTQAMIESAMRIHDSSIAVVVDNSVKRAIEPITGAVDDLTKREDAASSDRAKTNEAVGAIVNELGLEDQVQLGDNVKPGEKRPVRTLGKMSREGKVTAYAATLGFCATVVELAIKLLGH